MGPAAPEGKTWVRRYSCRHFDNVNVRLVTFEAIVAGNQSLAGALAPQHKGRAVARQDDPLNVTLVERMRTMETFAAPLFHRPLAPGSGSPRRSQAKRWLVGCSAPPTPFRDHGIPTGIIGQPIARAGNRRPGPFAPSRRTKN